MIIRSLLDTDLYKLTMMQGVLHQFPWAEVEYEFRCRTPGIDFLPIAAKIDEEISQLCELRFRKEELDYLAGLRFMKPDFIQFLRIFQFNRDFLEIDTENGFSLRIKGPWLHTILFEVPVLAIINELYFANITKTPDFEVGLAKLEEKIRLVREHLDKVPNFQFSDFGTRRRFSREWQERIIEVLKEKMIGHFRGTSNVFFARRFGITPIGTMAHEWLMAAQALGPRLAYSQKFALEHWAQEYRGDLGIALSDVVGFDAFLRDFDMYFAKLFDGARHDSGDPVKWGERLIAHYLSQKVDPMTKTAVFSDGLSFRKAVSLAEHFRNRIRVSFGIGTNLTNDIVEEPIQIVMKMTRCQGNPVAKLSDSPGKQMCNDEGYLRYLKSVFQVG